MECAKISFLAGLIDSRGRQSLSMRLEIELLCWFERLVRNIECLPFNIRNQQEHVPPNLIVSYFMRLSGLVEL